MSESFSIRDGGETILGVLDDIRGTDIFRIEDDFGVGVDF